MINQYEGIIKAVQLHESKMCTAFYGEGYSQAINDVVKLLYAHNYHIKGGIELIDKIQSLKPNEN